MRGSATPLLAIRDVWKEYPGVTALRGVSLNLYAGEVHALVGENGAGKSTLIRVLAGLTQPIRGVILSSGHEVRFPTARASQAAGISVISQEFRLVPQLTIAENIYLGAEPTRLGLINREFQHEGSRETLRSLGLELSPERRVDSLTVGDQQLVEIARALARDFRVLIMDEPTAALSEAEVKKLLGLVERIREQGAAVLYVSHRLPEVFQIADRISVLRDGLLVTESAASETTIDSVISQMLGRTLLAEQRDAARKEPTREPNHQSRSIESLPAIRVESLQCAGLLESVSLEVRPGEILGIAGLVGSGRSELVRGLFGAIPATFRRYELKGQRVEFGSPADALRHGVVMLSEDRKREGIFPLLSVLDNVVISHRRRGGLLGRLLIDRAQDRATFDGVQARMRIKAPAPTASITVLSGGNQQKALLGRALAADCNVLLLNEPTRGVDVGAKADIYQLLRELAESGIAVIISSSESAELATIATRCLALYAGRVSARLEGDEVTEANILAGSLGQWSRERETRDEVIATS